MAQCNDEYSIETDDLPSFDIHLRQKRHRWKWLVVTSDDRPMMHGHAASRAAASYAANRALFLLLASGHPNSAKSAAANSSSASMHRAKSSRNGLLNRSRNAISESQRLQQAAEELAAEIRHSRQVLANTIATIQHQRGRPNSRS